MPLQVRLFRSTTSAIVQQIKTAASIVEAAVLYFCKFY